LDDILTLPILIIFIILKYFLFLNIYWMELIELISKNFAYFLWYFYFHFFGHLSKIFYLYMKNYFLHLLHFSFIHLQGY
jgi:hypothetical protein